MLVLLLLVLAFQLLLIPYCLMIVLGLFGIQVGFWSCVAVLVVVRVFFSLMGGK